MSNALNSAPILRTKVKKRTLPKFIVKVATNKKNRLKMVEQIARAFKVKTADIKYTNVSRSCA